MARLALTFAILFFFITFSGAIHSTENEVVNNQDGSSKSMLDDADSNPTLLLPSEKSDQSSSDDDSASIEVEAIDVTDLVHVTLPETTTFVSFRPINRHFRMNHQLPLRYSRRRPCRHSVRPMNHRSRDISYGNDMILPNNENMDRDPELLFRDQVIPSMALRFQHEKHGQEAHHGRHHNKFMSKYEFARDKLKRSFSRKEQEKMENDKTENGGFVKRFRKFLNHF